MSSPSALPAPPATPCSHPRQRNASRANPAGTNPVPSPVCACRALLAPCAQAPGALCQVTNALPGSGHLRRPQPARSARLALRPTLQAWRCARYALMAPLNRKLARPAARRARLGSNRQPTKPSAWTACLVPRRRLVCRARRVRWAIMRLPLVRVLSSVAWVLRRGVCAKLRASRSSSRRVVCLRQVHRHVLSVHQARMPISPGYQSAASALSTPSVPCPRRQARAFARNARRPR